MQKVDWQYEISSIKLSKLYVESLILVDKSDYSVIVYLPKSRSSNLPL